jgi:hypothetical protein
MSGLGNLRRDHHFAARVNKRGRGGMELGQVHFRTLREVTGGSTNEDFRQRKRRPEAPESLFAMEAKVGIEPAYAALQADGIR